MPEKEGRTLTGRTAIATGGRRGIGWAVAHRFAAAGASIAIMDRDGPVGQAVTRAQSSAAMPGVPFLYVQADVTSEAEVEDSIARIVDRFGTVDVLVNNVGVGAPPKPIEDVSLEEWTKVINQSILGMFLCSREVAPHMKRQHRGAIVNMSSQAGRAQRAGCEEWLARRIVLYGPTGNAGRSERRLSAPDGAALAQLVRAPDCGSGGPWLEPTKRYQQIQGLGCLMGL